MGGSSGSSEADFYADEGQDCEEKVGEENPEAVGEDLGESAGEVDAVVVVEPVADTIVVLVENLPDGLLMLGEYLFLFVYHLMTAGC